MDQLVQITLGVGMTTINLQFNLDKFEKGEKIYEAVADAMVTLNNCVAQ